MQPVIDLMNKHLVTERCCMCTDIRTGGLLIGCSNITIYLILILINLAHPDLQDAMFLVVMLFPLALSSLFVYGIISNKSKFLLPEVVISIIGFGFFLFIGAIVCIFTCGLGLIFFGPLGALYWNLTSVKYSLYLRIDDENLKHPGVVHYTGEISPS